MSALLAVGVGAALGGVGRYALGQMLPTVGSSAEGFPYNTLAANLLGALLIGLVWGLWRAEPWFIAWGRSFFVIGVLGGFTTFSALALEAVVLTEAGRSLTAIVYVLSTTVLGILCTLLGYVLTRSVAS
ncbi:MAG: CrcB family protein [Pseudomonadota bacterium]